VKSTILIGDARKRLAELPEKSVRCVITSPPYFGLRDYGTADYEGGDPNCEHTISRPDAEKTAKQDERVTRGKRTECLNCGATRVDKQIGLEETPDAYVAEMVALFREVWRVLADDGTLWLNIGDSYAGGGGGNYNKTGISQAGGQHIANVRNRPEWLDNAGVKPKDLIGIPWRVALALQQDGWYLRSDIIWHKPNPMPESVTDRPTKSHEYVFLLTKSAKYYYDHEAVKEPVAEATVGRMKRGTSATHKNINGAPGQTKHGLAQPRDYDPDRTVAEKRNKRSVWTVNTKPFKGAHFAVMPEALVEPCVLAGSAPGDTVLDPFTGSGTVAVVALRHGRNFVGTELNPDYAEIAQKRITGDAPLMNGVTLA
jgi:DNA modification methylase